MPAETNTDAAGSVANPLEKLRGWQRFHIRLTALYGGTVFLCLLLIGLIFYQSGVNAEIGGLQKRLKALVTSLATSINGDQFATIAADATEPGEYQRRLKERFRDVATLDPDVATIYILRPTAEPTKLRFLVDYAKDGDEGQPGELYDASDLPIMLKGFSTPVVENEPYTDEFGTTLSGYAPIFNSAGQSVGIVGADVNVSRLQGLRNDVLYVVLGVFSVATLLIGLVSYAVARSVRVPLTQIINATAAIARGELNTRLNMKRNDEFGLMSAHFDNMVDGLKDREFVRETFGRYVSHDVASALLAHDQQPQLGGEERVVTVLFSDLRGYSTISEKLPPTVVVEMMNEYLGEMNLIIDKYHGCVIEFLGDGILAVFGAPYYLPDHSEKAVRCAMEMRQHLRELNKKWDESGLSRFWRGKGIEQLQVRIGIHHGPVVAGNLGSPTRMKYAVIGDTVNVAARLEALNKELHTNVLVSEDVYGHLPNDIAAHMTEQGSHQVKGRERSVMVYAVEDDDMAKVIPFKPEERGQ